MSGCRIYTRNRLCITSSTPNGHQPGEHRSFVRSFVCPNANLDLLPRSAHTHSHKHTQRPSRSARASRSYSIFRKRVRRRRYATCTLVQYAMSGIEMHAANGCRQTLGLWNVRIPGKRIHKLIERYVCYMNGHNICATDMRCTSV